MASEASDRKANVLALVAKRREMQRHKIKDDRSCDVPSSPGIAEAPLANHTEHKASVATMIAKRREFNRQKTEDNRLQDFATTEKHSGIRISQRYMRAEKWDMKMQGKEFVSVARLEKLQPKGPRSQVVIAVLCGTPEIRQEGSERIAESTITDLSKTASTSATVVFRGDALAFITSDLDGRLRDGIIIGLLNPVRTQRERNIRVDFEKQIEILGICPSFGLCKVPISKSESCRRPYNSEVAQACPAHTCPSQKRCHDQIDSKALGSVRAQSLPTPTRSRSSQLLALEQATERLKVGAEQKTQLQELKALEALEVDANVLRLAESLQARVASLASSEDDTGIAARRLRRKWRALIASSGASQPDNASYLDRAFQKDSSSATTSKRMRIGG